MRERKKLKLWEAERSGEKFLHGRFTALSFSGGNQPGGVCVYVYIYIYSACVCVWAVETEHTHEGLQYIY